MNDMSVLLTARQLQDLLQVERITIYRMLKDGRLHGFKVGGQWRFARQDVDRWLQEQQINLQVPIAPHVGGEARPSTESLPIGCIQAIQDIFAEALGVGTITTGLDGTPLTTFSHCSQFCKLIQSTEAGRQRCTGSWQAAAASPSMAGPQVSVCHAGLNHVWSHIQIQNTVIAVTHAGQFLTQIPDDNDGPERLNDLAANTGLQIDSLQAALALVPVLDPDKLGQVQRLLGRVTGTFSEIGEERRALLGRLRRIAEMTGY